MSDVICDNCGKEQEINFGGDLIYFTAGAEVDIADDDGKLIVERFDLCAGCVEIMLNAMPSLRRKLHKNQKTSHGK